MNMDPGPKKAPSRVYWYTHRSTAGPLADARADREYSAPWIRPCSELATLLDLMAEMVGKAMAPKLAMATAAKMVALSRATPYMTLWIALMTKHRVTSQRSPTASLMTLRKTPWTKMPGFTKQNRANAMTPMRKWLTHAEK
jgi:hypothetical protein